MPKLFSTNSPTLKLWLTPQLKTTLLAVKKAFEINHFDGKTELSKE
jgi:hypothetical protein